LDVGYILKCSESEGLSLFYFILTLFWIIVAMSSTIYNLWLKQDQCLYLQRMILIFPIFKLAHVVMITTNIQICENQEQWETANKYLIMGIISFQTLA